MAKPWDDALKRLIHTNPLAFVLWLVPNAQFIQELPVVLEQEELNIDGLLEIVANGKRMLLHIEIQTYNDSEMRERLLRYNVLARMKYKLPVRSCVIYLLMDGIVGQSPLIWDAPDGEEVLEFHFLNIELSKLSFEDILHTKQAALLPLLSLSKGGASRDGVKRMFREIQQTDEIDDTRKAELELLGYTLAALVFRRNSKADQEWLIRRFQEMHDRLRESPIYQEILREGIREGIEEGLEKGRLDSARNMLLRFVDARFHILKGLAQEQALLIEDVKTLEKLAFRIGAAQTIEDARQHLLTWKEGKPNP